MYPRLGLTRTILRRNYALITPDGYVASALPGWVNCTAYVIISSAMGARVTQLVIDLAESGSGQGETQGDEWFFYIASGSGRINGRTLNAGGFAFVSAGNRYEVFSEANGTRLLIFRKRYEPLTGTPETVAKALEFVIGQEQDIASAPFLGDPRAQLKLLLPDAPGMDMAVNLFTYEPGATLPFVETHIMEHGMLFLDGSGVYRLDEDWHPVQTGDSIWIAPYCPQWFIAAGPGPARYIYYKDVNRMP